MVEWEAFGLTTGLGFELTGLMILIFVLIMLLKGYALWNSARNNHVIWFIALLFFNTLGILPLIYMIIHVWRKPKKKRR